MADILLHFRFMHELSQEEFADLNELQRVTIASVRSLDPILSGPAEKKIIAKPFPLDVLFGPKVQNLSGINAELCESLNKNCYNLIQRCSQKTVKHLARELYNGAKVRTVTVVMTKATVAAGKREVTPTSPLNTDSDSVPVINLTNLRKGYRTTWQ